LLDAAQCQVQVLRGNLAEWAPAAMRGDAASLPYAGELHALDAVRLLAPIERGNKVVVVGANYRKHLKEFNLAADTQPVAFLKPFGAVIGAYDDIRYSPLTTQLDYEVELIVVMGATLTPGGNPMHCILGYAVGNDVSQRDLQRGTPGIGMDFLSGKGLDGTSPIGPWIVTRDEFGNAPPDLEMTLHVNGERRQIGRSSDMTWDVGRLAVFVDARSALEPGDVMFTGTPPGVAQGDGRFLQHGDVVESAIEHLGTLRNVVRKPGVDA
jgi:2-keto-4-pentenoate hydratase/2-oxohepta-3-ene-1,7-dioic acid hydratase in catechol pathway